MGVWNGKHGFGICAQSTTTIFTQRTSPEVDAVKIVNSFLIKHDHTGFVLQLYGVTEFCKQMFLSEVSHGLNKLHRAANLHRAVNWQAVD